MKLKPLQSQVHNFSLPNLYWCLKGRYAYCRNFCIKYCKQELKLLNSDLKSFYINFSCIVLLAYGNMLLTQIKRNCRAKVIGGGRPLLCENLVYDDPPVCNTPIFDLF